MAARLSPIVINAKAYAEVTGPRVERLAQLCSQAAAQAGRDVALALPAIELGRLGALAAGALPGVQLLAQHCDPHPPGAATGWTTAESVQAAGARGSLLNHAEHKVPHAQLAAAKDRLHGAGLWSILCADSLQEAGQLARLQPTAVAIEPPELIGGNVSVTTADPGIVRDACAAIAAAAPDALRLCGAGVKSGDDVRAALGLGCHGVLLASGVVKARDPGAALADLLAGL